MFEYPYKKIGVNAFTPIFKANQISLKTELSKFPRFCLQFRSRLFALGIDNTGINGANGGALLLIEMAHALSALIRIYLIDLFSSFNGLIRTFRLTRTTIDTLIINHKSHLGPPRNNNNLL
jgi:hypothetical protein